MLVNGHFEPESTGQIDVKAETKKLHFSGY